MTKAISLFPATDPPIFRFKITLLEIDPPIWRRIELPEGTLDSLHKQIQTAMGWTKSHLHQFEIAGQRYGDPELLDDGWEDEEFTDSTTLRLSNLLKTKRDAFRFFYEYDFGDGWRHEVIYEGLVPAEPSAKYPRCIDGARACPPEDVGGPWGYSDFQEAIRDPKHAEHRGMLRWVGRRFDPEKFSSLAATKRMHRGLPDWRNLR